MNKVLLLCLCAIAQIAYTKTKDTIPANYYGSLIFEGTPDSIIIVSADTINKALKEDKNIYIEYCKVEGHLTFHNRDVQYPDVNFRNVEFDGLYADDATFYSHLTFTMCVFTQNVYINELNCPDAYFYACTFKGAFRCYYSKFEKHLQFTKCTFEKEITFNQTVFNNVRFIGNNFKQGINLKDNQFEETTIFRGCLLTSNDTIDFTNTYGFSRFEFPWFPDSNGFSLKKCVVYDPVFFLALEKNYRDQGKYAEANDVYFTHRTEQRKLKPFFLKTCEYLFLELTYGYGMRPMRILWTALILILLFSQVYLLNLRSHTKNSWFTKIVYSFYFALDNFFPGSPLRSEAIIQLKNNNVVGFCLILQKLIGWYLIALILLSQPWAH